MSCLVASHILNEIQISEDIEITLYSLLGNIKHCCESGCVYRDICRDIYSVILPVVLDSSNILDDFIISIRQLIAILRWDE